MQSSILAPPLRVSSSKHIQSTHDSTHAHEGSTPSMAEWTGRKQAQHSPTSTRASQRNQEVDDTPQAPETPGAVDSPQHPGEVPDRSTVPGQFRTRVPRAKQVRRPLTEYGTSQAIMNVYAPPAENPLDPARFEQATAAYEELRKAYPAQLPPDRPAPGYALSEGDRMASELQAIDAGPAPSAPANASGEPYNAAPGAPTADAGRTVAPPARLDAPAAQVGSAFSPSDAPESVRSPSDAVAGSGAVDDAKAGGDRPRPGDASSPGGTLAAEKDGQVDVEGEGHGLPPVAPQ